MKYLSNKYYALMAMLALSPLGAFAASSGSNTYKKLLAVQDEGGNILSLIFNGAQIIGVCFVLFALLKIYKKHNAQNSQIEWSSIFWIAFVGAFLLGFRYVVGDAAALTEGDNDGVKRNTVNW